MTTVTLTRTVVETTRSRRGALDAADCERGAVSVFRDAQAVGRADDGPDVRRDRTRPVVSLFHGRRSK